MLFSRPPALTGSSVAKPSSTTTDLAKVALIENRLMNQMTKEMDQKEFQSYKRHGKQS
jgi:hypothetical protein